MLRRCQLHRPHHWTSRHKFLLHRSPPCQFLLHRSSRQRPINGVDFLVLRFCQTLPAFCPLVTLLATVATLAFKLGWTVLVSQGALRLALALALGLALD